MMGQQTPATLVLFVVLLLHATLVKSLVDIQHTSHQLNNSVDWSIEFERYIDNQVSIQFMPGNYEVENNTVITNVRNFSITGESSSASDVTFNCTKFSAWIVDNSSFIEINNVRFLNCGKRYDIQPFKNISSAIFIYNVSSIRILNVNIENSCGYGIIGLDNVGRSTFEHVTINGNNGLSTLCDNCTISGGMILLNLRENEDMVQENTVINIKHSIFLNIQLVLSNECIYPIKYFNSSVIGLFLYQDKYHIEVNIGNVSITNIITYKSSIISISYSMNSTSNVIIANSSITNTYTTYSTVEISYKDVFNETNAKLVHIFLLTDCEFFHNDAADHVFNMKNINNGSLSVQLKNNVFKSNIARDTLFKTKAVLPLLSGYSNFSNNIANVIFSMTNYVLLDDGALFSFSNNTYPPKCRKYRNLVRKNNKTSPECPFQFVNGIKNVRIIFHNNIDYYRPVYGNSLFSCSWIPSFSNREKLLPNEIYNKYNIMGLKKTEVFLVGRTVSVHVTTLMIIIMITVWLLNHFLCTQERPSVLGFPISTLILLYTQILMS